MNKIGDGVRKTTRSQRKRFGGGDNLPNHTLLLESCFLNGICDSGVFEILFGVKACLLSADQHSSICDWRLTFILLFGLGKKDNSSKK